MARKIGSNGDVTAARVRGAALRLFARQGYAAVSMRAIAAEVGLQVGALYNHFPTKQALLVNLLERHMTDLLEAWEAESRAFDDPLQALEGFVRFHIRFHFDKQDAVFISYMELRNLEEAGYLKIERLRRYYEGYLRKIISIGKENGVFLVDDIPVASMALIAMLTGVSTWFKNTGRLSVREIEDVYVAMALGAVGVSGNSVAQARPNLMQVMNG